MLPYVFYYNYYFQYMKTCQALELGPMGLWLHGIVPIHGVGHHGNGYELLCP